MGNQTANITFYMGDGEIKIVKNAIKGDAASFGSLYDHYQPMIYRFIAVKVARREDAEDLTHQVFLSAWQNMPKYHDLGHPFSSWLYRIARNQVIDYYRAQKGDASLDETHEETIAIPAVVHLELGTKLAVEKVFTALRKLKLEYQDVVILRFIEELPIKETAKAMERSEGAIKLLQHRAIKELQKLCKDVEDITFD